MSDAHLCPDGGPGPCDEHGHPLGHHDEPVFLERPHWAVLILVGLAAATPVAWIANPFAGVAATVALVGQGWTVYGLARVGATVAEHERLRLAPEVDSDGYTRIDPDEMRAEFDRPVAWDQPGADPLGDVSHWGDRFLDAYINGPNEQWWTPICGRLIRESNQVGYDRCTLDPSHLDACQHEPGDITEWHGIYYRRSDARSR